MTPTGTKHCCPDLNWHWQFVHVTQILANLLWLPVILRIDFKILLITFKALNGSAPNYINDLLIPNTPVWSLRLAYKALLVNPRSQPVTEGDMAAVRAPKTVDLMGNSLNVLYISY